MPVCGPAQAEWRSRYLTSARRMISAGFTLLAAARLSRRARMSAGSRTEVVGAFPPGDRRSSWRRRSWGAVPGSRSVHRGGRPVGGRGLRAALPAFSVEDVADCLRRGGAAQPRPRAARGLHSSVRAHVPRRERRYRGRGARSGHRQHRQLLARRCNISFSDHRSEKRPHYDRGDRRSPPDRDRWRRTAPRRHRRRSSRRSPPLQRLWQ